MIVFKTFLKVLKSARVPIIMYTVFLVFFGTLNMQTKDESISFEPTKPDVLIINNDENVGITKNLIDYITKNATIAEVKTDEDSIKDALFYRDANYVIYIPKNYRNDVLNGLNPKIEVKSSGNYESSSAELLLKRYIKVMNIYTSKYNDEVIIIDKINSNLSKDIGVEIVSKIDNKQLSNAAFYYNFTNYSLLAGCVYAVCLVLSTFRAVKISKRITISSMDYKKHNRLLLLSNGLFSFVLWLIYVILSFIFVGDVMFTAHGILYILNSFIFMLCALTIAFLIGNLITNKDTINGIINVVSLGSSFLCGAFVPAEFLPDAVLKIAHILPSYYYINNNDTLKGIQEINLETLKPIIINMTIIIFFAILFIVLANVISKNKRKIG